MTQPSNGALFLSPDDAASAANAAAAANRLISADDQRSHATVDSYVKQNLGVPRPRSMTLSIPLGASTPIGTTIIIGSPPVTIAGWLTSFPIFQNVRVVGWAIQALTPGALQIDLQVANSFVDPAIPPVLTSLLNDPAAPVPNYLALNGYNAYSYDTSGWFQRDIPAASFVHVIVQSAVTVAQASLGLQLMDLQGKTLQI